jgi:hypothetical protein
MKFLLKNKSLPSLKLSAPKISATLPNLPFANGISKKVQVPGKIPSFGGFHISGAGWKIGVMGLALGIGIVAFSSYFAIKGVKAAPIYPDPAIYDVARAYNAGNKTLQVGDEPKFTETTTQVERQEATMTLRLNTGGARIGDMYFENLSIGAASGLTDSLQIVGQTANAGNNITANWFTCETIIIDGLETPSLNIANSEIYALTVQDNVADGLSISSTLSNGVYQINVGSNRGSITVPDVSNSTYDRIILDAGTSSESICQTLTLKDVKAYGAGVNLDNIKAGSLIIKNSVVGDGDGIDIADFVIEDSVKVTSTTLTNNIEKALTVK